jgi:DNA polymerase delta subunit 1
VICFQGNSVCCYVHGFHPYFYVPAPPNFTEKNLPDFRIALNQAVLTDLKNNKGNVGQAILDVALENKSSIYGFQVSFILFYYLKVAAQIRSILTIEIW